MVSLSAVSVSHCQPRSENISWKTPRASEILFPCYVASLVQISSLKTERNSRNNSYILSCVLPRAARWNLALSSSVPRRTWIPLLSGISTLYTLPSPQSPGTVQVIGWTVAVAVLVSRSPVFYLIMVPSARGVMLAIQISQREVTKVFSLREKVKVLDLRKEKKKSYAEAGTISGKAKSLWNCEEGNRNSCYFCCRTSNCRSYSIGCDKCLVKRHGICGEKTWPENDTHTWGSLLCADSGTHWGSWNVFPSDKGETTVTRFPHSSQI